MVLPEQRQERVDLRGGVPRRECVLCNTSRCFSVTTIVPTLPSRSIDARFSSVSSSAFTIVTARSASDFGPRRGVGITP
ncbi:MAG: hypothetical protein QOC93_3021 [Actinomycetota bacterium]|nr:hypothetical protein [Actinomycetota bacterium]